MNPRAISPAESELVRWLLTHAARREAAETLASQIAELRVSGRCDCGCPSVDFLVEGLSSTASIVAEAEGVSPSGAEVGVILWARAGRLSGLEIYEYGDGSNTVLPRPADLHPCSVLGT